jgi:hypothetical protein
MRDRPMEQRKGQLPALDAIPGLSIEDISRENAEFVITLKYVTEKQQKTYRLIAGKTGLRFELNSYRAR